MLKKNNYKTVTNCYKFDVDKVGFLVYNLK